MSSRLRVTRFFMALGALCSALVLLVSGWKLAQANDRQLEEAYQLLSAGCVTNKVPFFSTSPDTIQRREISEGIEEIRQYGRNLIRTLSAHGKLFVAEIVVAAETPPDELRSIFELPLQQFLLRYGRQTKKSNSEYVYGDGFALLKVRFNGETLAELKWTCGRD
jgi:hypothetical protein